VHREHAGAVRDLPAARLAVASGHVRARFPHVTEERLAHRHRDLVLLLLQAVGAGDPTAGDLELDHPQLRDQGEQVERRLPDPVPSLLAGRVVRNRHRERPEVGPELAALVHEEEELAKVIRRLAHRLQVLVLDAQNLVRLALEHQAAARGVRHDRQALAGVGDEVGDEPPHVLPCRREVSVGLQREAAAVLRRDDHVVAVVLEDGDDHLPDAGLVVVGAAGVEIDDAPVGGRALVSPRPALEGPAGKKRHGGVAVNPK
jgi:hypothetical protein